MRSRCPFAARYGADGGMGEAALRGRGGEPDPFFLQSALFYEKDKGDKFSPCGAFCVVCCAVMGPRVVLPGCFGWFRQPRQRGVDGGS